MTLPTSSAFPPVESFLASLALAPRQAHKLLTVWPLLGTAPTAAPAYVSLAEALERGDVAITELPQGASVPYVLVSNRGGVAVLVLFGEELRGALQNRTANASFLIPPGGEVEIDVSCVEQGRWSSRPGQGAMRFGSSGDVLSSSLRAKMHAKVALARKRGLRFDADQGEVWGEVADRVAYSRALSPSGAYADYIATRQRDLDEASAAFACVPGQVGFVAAIGDEVVGLEAIGRPEVFAKALPGLLRAYLVDAIDAALVREPRASHAERPASRSSRSLGADPGAAGDAPPVPPAPRFDAPEAFLAALREAPADTGPSLGLGIDVRIAGEGVCGCALVEGDVVHLTAFPPAAERAGRPVDPDDEEAWADDELCGLTSEPGAPAAPATEAPPARSRRGRTRAE